MGCSLSLAVRKKKKKNKMKVIKTVALQEISEEVLIEILLRLPAKSLMRFKCVSNLWLSLMTSRYFTNRFVKPSSSRRRLFAYLTDIPTLSKYAFLTSSWTHDHSVVSVMRWNYSVWNYLGHDPVHDEYKVISFVLEDRNKMRGEHQVLVLGPGASWRKIQCNIPHIPFHPYTQGISFNGVLYYKAFTGANKRVLMSFDLSSEEFSLIELPNELREMFLTSTSFMNYRGKVAYFEYTIGDIVDVWVLEDADKSQWLDKKTFVLPLSHMNIELGDGRFRMCTTSRSGQVWFTDVFLTRNIQPARFCIYDLETNEIITQRIEMGPLPRRFNKTSSVKSTFWDDDIESIMFLET